jgi:hypothetical protein
MKPRYAIAAFGIALMGQSPAPPTPESPKPEAGAVFRVERYPKDEPPPPPKVEEPKEVVLENTGQPIKVPFACTEADISQFGMTCTDRDPCPVFMELAAIQPLGSKIFLTGNLHNGSTTMYSMLLASDDAGKTWREPVERIKSGGLDQVEFFDFENGWISGQILLSMPRDPFFLVTTDGGKNWRRRPVFSESRVAAIEQFHFDSKTQGSLIIDRTQGAETPRYEHHESMTGGESWSVREVSGRALRLKTARAPGNTDWRLEPDAKLKAHAVQKRTDGKWARVALFTVQVGECKPALAALPEPPPQAEPAAQPAPSRAPARRPASPTNPTLKKRR